MGLSVGFSSCRCEVSAIKEVENNVNPNPRDFKLIKAYFVNGYLLVMVKYNGCTNYEGNKILMYKGISVNDVLSAKKLDPHFCEDCEVSPMARFEPTDEGWDMALRFIRLWDL